MDIVEIRARRTLVQKFWPQPVADALVYLDTRFLLLGPVRRALVRVLMRMTL